MHSKNEIFKWVTEVLKREFDFKDEDLLPTTHLSEDLDLDSIDAIDMAVRLEEKANLHFEEKEIRSLETIQDVVDLIHARL